MKPFGRFAYRHPGINVLAVRTYQAAATYSVTETPAYLGCKSWVELDAPLSIEGSVPVTTDKVHEDVKWQLEMLLRPTGLA